MTEIPLRGDRAARDSLGYPTLHASDLEAGTPVQHLPDSASAGDAPIWNGSVWYPSPVTSGSYGIAIPRTRQHVFTVAGNLSPVTGDLRIYNRTGHNLTIVSVFISVDTPSSGSSIIVDINLNGTTIFTTQSNRPTIAAGAYTGETTTIEVNAWNYGSNYLQVDVDQVGSGTPGSNLTVHIVTQGVDYV
jgi:hypothetical protein